jgi:hypothetical protein
MENVVVYTITESNFLDWYFNTGPIDEQLAVREGIAKDAVEALTTLGMYQLKVKDIWDWTDKGVIPVKYLQEGDTFKEAGLELGDLDYKWNINLIKNK